MLGAKRPKLGRFCPLPLPAPVAFQLASFSLYRKCAGAMATVIFAASITVDVCPLAWRSGSGFGGAWDMAQFFRHWLMNRL